MNSSEQPAKETSRRHFLRSMAAAPTLALACGSSLLPQVLPSTQSGSENRLREKVPSQSGKFVAIQIGARSFVDEGVEACLDTLQQTGGVNVVMATVFTYGTGLAGRQVQDQPLPDHGVKEYDRVHGGSFTRVHPEFYADSPIKEIRAPELSEFDILGDVIPKAKARGMQTYALLKKPITRA
jgi:hypothetical protein